jgi:hypothetical protein
MVNMGVRKPVIFEMLVNQYVCEVNTADATAILTKNGIAESFRYVTSLRWVKNRHDCKK